MLLLVPAAPEFSMFSPHRGTLSSTWDRRQSVARCDHGECADLTLTCEEVGVQPDLKAIAHGDFRRCRVSLCLGVCWRAGERMRIRVPKATAELPASAR
jgi:hypothetical protein